MKAATLAAAASILTVVLADRRDDRLSSNSTWDPWTATSSKSVSASTTTSASTWSDWDPSTSTTTSTAAWGDWSTTTTTATTSSVTSVNGTTWTNWDPTQTMTSTSTQWVTVTLFSVTGADGSWTAWSSVGTPVAGTTTNTNTVTVTGTVTKTSSVSNGNWGTWANDPSAGNGNWATWSSVSAPIAAATGKPSDGQCVIQVSLSYGAPLWYPTPVIASSSSVNTWDPWANSKTSATPSKATTTASAQTWGQWSASTGSASTKVSSAKGIEWNVWAGTGSYDPAKATTANAGGASWNTWTDSASSSPTKATSTISDGANWNTWADGTATTPIKGSSTASVSTPAAWSAWSASAGSSTAGASSSASASWSAWPSSTGSITANGNFFGMTYSPYTAAGGCKDQASVAADIAKMASFGFSSVRVYSTDCSTLENVGSAARSYNMKLILGVFISETGIAGARPQVDAIAQWAQWDLVELIVVGNEAVFQGRCSASDLAGFIVSSKAAFQAAGFGGKVSTTDELSIWQSQGSAWCDAIDVVTANLYAFFNPDTTAANAGAFIQSEIEALSQICPGKEVYVMESGWPSAGECNGLACPSPENQATAIKGIQQTSGAKVVFFSFEDELWKQPGQFGVEQHWGCASIFS